MNSFTIYSGSSFDELDYVTLVRDKLRADCFELRSWIILIDNQQSLHNSAPITFHNFFTNLSAQSVGHISKKL